MKIFISYTVRDKEVTRNMLEAFSESLRTFGTVYVDLIDNDSEEKQERVISELDTSDILLLIESSETYSSPWVQLELERANSKSIEIHTVPYWRLKDFLKSELSLESLLPTAVWKKQG